MKNNKIYFILSLLFTALILTTAACNKDDDDDQNNGGSGDENTGKIHLDFDFVVDGKPLQFDTLMYTNAAGNKYLVYEVQYFLTQLTIYKDGKGKVLKGWEKEHYVDTNIPGTLGWDVYDKIESGSYDSLSFRFGFTDADNQSYMFVNSPEKDMVWPDYLGGGYHYMKLNGKWLTPDNKLRGFAFHIGRGQVYDSTGNPISFIDNSFYVSLKNSDFKIEKGKYTKMTVRMHVEEWFENPVVYDHNQWGGDIMQNQAAMATAVRNGWNVFELIK
jgi:hypothetical protein